MKNFIVYLKNNFIVMIAFICNICLFFYNSTAMYTTKAYQTDTIKYAKVNDNCVLYKSQTMSDSLSNIFFYVPSTYFVSIISKVSDSIYKVQYDNFVGFVFDEAIEIVSFIPTNAKPQGITFDISQKAGTQIWTLPSDTEGNILTTISADTKQIEYVALATGQVPIGGSSNVWYFARYTPASNTTQVFEGYVYSEATTNLSHIANNLEYEPTMQNNFSEKQISVSPVAQIIMITLICLPFLVLLILACIKTARAIKNKKVSVQKQNQQDEQINIKPKQFVRKKHDKNSVEVVFPEYNYIDDDDLL